MTARSPRTWLITGCSSGFGAEIARQVLEAGDQAIVTARNPQTVEAIVAAHSGRALAAPLDVTKSDEIANAVDLARQRFGGIDVLVNNAGASYLTSIEEGDEARIRKLFETNFFGPLALVRATLPVMREKRSGHIINFSSIGGLAAFAASGYYAATKFALEGMSEALAQEVGPLGIRVTIVEPGPFRTGMAVRAEHSDSRNPDYEQTVHARRAQFRANADDFPGDPAKGAEAVISLAGMAEPPLRLLLGESALTVARKRYKSVLDEFDRWESLTTSTDFQQATGNWANVLQGKPLGTPSG